MEDCAQIESNCSLIDKKSSHLTHEAKLLLYLWLISMSSFLNRSFSSDKLFLVDLMVGGYILSFVLSFIGSFPIGFPSASLSVFIESVFTTLTIYSAIVSAWIFYHVTEHIQHTKIFLVISFMIIVATSLLLISANFYFRFTLYLRSVAVLLIGITPLVSFFVLHQVISKNQLGQRWVIIYLLCMAIFLLSWGIYTMFQPFRLPNILEISLLGIVSFLYNVVALVSLLLTIQLVYNEGKSLKFLLLPSLIYIIIGVSIGLYLQRNTLGSFRLFEMIISEPWRWTIGYNMPFFSRKYNYIFYLIYPASVLPLGWSLLKKVYKTHVLTWRFILFGWMLLFVCGASSSDAFEIIGKLIGYSLLLLGFLNILSIERMQEDLHRDY